MALYQKHHNHKTFFPWCTEKCAEAEISCFVLRRNISPRGSMWFVGVQTCATFCRPPFIQTCWNRRHKWWCRHILGPKIKMRHKTITNYMPARGQDIELYRNTFSKKDWHMDIVLLHLELSLNFSRHIRHGRVLTNTGLWSRIHEIQIGVSRKAGCPWKPWTLQKRINNWNWCSETYYFSNIGHPPGRVTSLCSAVTWNWKTFHKTCAMPDFLFLGIHYVMTFRDLTLTLAWDCNRKFTKPPQLSIC